MKVKIKKLHVDAKIPKYAKLGDSGFDLSTVENITILAGQTAIVNTGLSFEIPIGYEMQVRPRSGISAKTKLRVSNAPGTVDSQFRGQVGVIIDNIDHNNDIFIEKGTRIAQGVLCAVEIGEFEEVEELSSTDRGDGAYGSTGVK